MNALITAFHEDPNFLQNVRSNDSYRMYVDTSRNGNKSQFYLPSLQALFGHQATKLTLELRTLARE